MSADGVGWVLAAAAIAGLALSFFIDVPFWIVVVSGVYLIGHALVRFARAVSEGGE